MRNPGCLLISTNIEISLDAARSPSNTFAGIAPDGAAAFIGAQLLGAFGAVMLARWLWPS